jgi:hypothetical protein
LAEHPGQLVTKEELFQEVWPQTVVSEAALTRRIGELRQALRDDPKAPRYIETVHRQGFRFIAPVTPSPQPVTRPASRLGQQAQAGGFDSTDTVHGPSADKLPDGSKADSDRKTSSCPLPATLQGHLSERSDPCPVHSFSLLQAAQCP